MPQGRRRGEDVSRPSVVLATKNPGKVEELRRILGGDVELLGLRDVTPYEPGPETGATFEENALAKAREAVHHTGLPAVADDSGLAVDALNGMPGVLSARWSGVVGADKDSVDERNNALLLDQLADVPDERRTAYFTCAVALVHAGGELVVHGRMDGRVIPRHGYPVWFDGKQVDLVRSGAMSPSLGYSIGTTFLPAAAAKSAPKRRPNRSSPKPC